MSDLTVTAGEFVRALAEEHGDFLHALERFPTLKRADALALLARAADELGEPLDQRPDLKVVPDIPDDIGLVRVFCDGAARGNPGPAGAGAVVQTRAGEVLARAGRYLGETTNNVAEYEGLLLGLRHARDLGATEVQVLSDSQLMVKQIRGEYKVKAEHLKPLCTQALDALDGFERWQVSHVLREQNSAADQMANRAIDERMDD